MRLIYILLLATIITSCDSISESEKKVDYFPLFEGKEYSFNYKLWEGDWLFNITERGTLSWKVVRENNSFLGKKYSIKSQIIGQSISRRWNDGIGIWYDSVVTQRNELQEFTIEESLDSLIIPRIRLAIYDHSYGKFKIPRFTENKQDTLSIVTNNWDRIILLKGEGLFSYTNGDGGNYSWGIIVERKQD